MRYLVDLGLVAAITACSSHHPRTVRVAAASDVARAFEELGRAFEAKTHIKPIVTFGSSGLLAKQIEEAAPFYLFAAANREYVDEVVKTKHCDAATQRPYARGHLVVWCPPEIVAPRTLAELADPRFKRIAIANPEHAPYGRAAQQALQKAGIWDQVQGKLELGDNIQATLQYAKRGAVDAALVAQSLVTGASLPIDLDQYDPLDQQLVVCGDGPEADAARELADFITSPDGAAVLAKYGLAR